MAYFQLKSASLFFFFFYGIVPFLQNNVEVIKRPPVLKIAVVNITEFTGDLCHSLYLET